MEKDTVLIVEDSLLNRKYLRRLLSSYYHVEDAENGQEALDLLQKHSEQTAAILLDLKMPVMSGMEFLERYHDMPQLHGIPVIVLTGTADTDEESKCLELGAYDFAMKPFNNDVLLLRLRNAIEHSEIDLLRQLRYQSEYSMVAGIYNKQTFFTASENMMKSNPNQKHALVLFDIKNFTLVNRFYGHEEGDRFIRYTADLLKSIGENLKQFSYGHAAGDRFLICMAYDTRDELLQLLESLRQSMRHYPLSFDIVPTFGIVLAADGTQDLNRLFDEAEMARNSCSKDYCSYYAFFEPSMEDGLVREHTITGYMDEALRSSQFVVYYQPKYTMKDRTVCGCEALIRWKRKDDIVSLPSEFLPIFERNGFMTKIDMFVCDSVCAQIQKWIQDGKQPFPVSVNISQVSLNDPQLADKLTELVKKYEIPAYMLQLEITESSYTLNLGVSSRTLKKLRDSGFTILIDDFGRGLSSLNTLKDIDFDILKLDMEFLTDTDQESGELIASYILKASKQLNMPVIAESVQTDQQAKFLQDAGCEYVQGFYFSKPLPKEEYEKLWA